MTRLWILIALTITMGLLASSPAAAQATFPASWEGVWVFDSVIRDCDTNEIVETTMDEPDTLCAGDAIDIDEEGQIITCDGTITETNINLTCGSSFDPFPGCTATINVSIQGTRTGDSFSGNQTFSLTYTGACGPLTDYCEQEQITGTRTGPVPVGFCESVPVVPATWGRVKAIYN